MKLKTLFSAALALLALTQVACAEATSTSQAKEGKDYTVYSGAKGTDKPEVLEFLLIPVVIAITWKAFWQNGSQQSQKK